MLARAALVLLLAAGANAAAHAEGPSLEGKFGERWQVAATPEPAPQAAFQTRDGETVTLADFAGRVVLVNFWATWCAPCIEEMPTLDALEADLGSPAFEVLAVSEDMGGREVVEPFLRDKLSLETLAIYLDPKGELARAFGLRGMPTTYLIDARGRVVGSLEGPADWHSAPVKALIRHYLARAEAAG
jgi:thiol-disulfide isomerase/thioredoxin